MPPFIHLACFTSRLVVGLMHKGGNKTFKKGNFEATWGYVLTDYMENE